MSIKCSLLGHRFGETTVEREREEEGTEVVITITELETCTRCGETRVVSENKEVTTLETPADAGSAGNGGASDADPVADAGTDVDSDATASGGTDAEIIEGTGDDAAGQADARTETTIPDAESDTAAAAEAGEDDAVIIDDAGDDREPGEWPDEDDSAPADEGADDPAPADEDDGDDERDPGEWPEEPDGLDPAERAGETAEVEILGSDEDEESTEAAASAAGGTADPATGVGEAAGGERDDAGADRTPDLGAVEAETSGADASGADATSEPGTPGDAVDAASAAVGVDEDTAEWPDDSEGVRTTPGDMGDWPEETKRDEPAESGVSGPSLDGEAGPSITVPEGMFKCSECGYTTEVESSSLRAGDFCPECRRGTLVQRADADEE